MYKVTKTMADSVKECVDTIYELTQDWYEVSFASFKNGRMTLVVSELVKRGVLSKRRAAPNENNIHFAYKWVAGSAPTKTFYLSIAQTLGQKQQDYDIKYRSKKNSNKVVKMDSVKPGVKDEPIIIVQPEKADLSSATIDELWAELKSRGVVIEDNHLVVVERRVIA